MMDSINNRIYNFLLEEKTSSSSRELLKKFFKMDISDEKKAEMIVSPLLENDSRFVKEGGRWKAKKIKAIEELPLTEVGFLLFYAGEFKTTAINLDVSIEEIKSFMNQFSFFLQWRNFDTLVVRDPISAIADHKRYVLVPYNRASLSFIKKVYRKFIGSEPDFKTLSLRCLIKSLFPERSIKNWENVAEDFNLDYSESESPESRVKTLSSVFSHTILQAQRSGCTTLAQLIELSSSRTGKIDFKRFDFDRGFLKAIPEMPGVYIFRDRDRRIIYVGKASNLRTRINSYFWNTGESPEKMKRIFDALFSIEYRILGSELSALIEEYRLIKKYLPEVNVKVDFSADEIRTTPKILIMPSLNERAIELFFVADTIPLKRCEYSGNEDAKVISILEEIDESGEYITDAEKNIAISYFNQYEEFINRIEVDRYRDYEDILRILKNFIGNIEEVLGRRIHYT